MQEPRNVRCAVFGPMTRRPRTSRPATQRLYPAVNNCATHDHVNRSKLIENEHNDSNCSNQPKVDRPNFPKKKRKSEGTSCFAIIDSEVFHTILTLSLPRAINLQFPLQPHQKYNITQYGELGFSYRTQMTDEYTTNSHYLTHIVHFRKVGRMHFLNLGVKRLRKTPRTKMAAKRLALTLPQSIMDYRFRIPGPLLDLPRSRSSWALARHSTTIWLFGVRTVWVNGTFTGFSGGTRPTGRSAPDLAAKEVRPASCCVVARSTKHSTKSCRTLHVTRSTSLRTEFPSESVTRCRARHSGGHCLGPRWGRKSPVANSTLPRGGWVRIQN